jgi:hypothetical protein
MGCPAEIIIGDNLVFSICTHDPETSVLTDADAAPDYWVYEDETAAEIISGTMAKFDTKTGHYTELIGCTAVAGFKNGKTYTIFINATVGSDKGGISYGFKAVTGLLASEVDNDGNSITMSGALKLILSVLCGKSAGGGTPTITFKDLADSKDRISATVNSVGDRTSIGTRDAS